jgi:uncharacterized protein (DUF362 family)/NAD-dependent dihydropyrimidine dehydrogenase PreA subunit
MSKLKVSVVRARDYECYQIYSALERCIELIGGLKEVIRPGSRVLIKINHLPPASVPEKGIVTHPVFTEAVIQLLKNYGAHITVGDDIESASGYRVSGYYEMCRRAGVRLVNLREIGFRETKCNGRFLDKAYLSKVALNADVIVNVPKLKTHSLTILTGGVKNMYGIIPKGLRTRFHGEYVSSEDFGEVLTDIFSTLIPQLTIMDGIIAMEGEGPAVGRLRQLGLIFASRDAVAVDAVVSKIIGLEPMGIHTTHCCTMRGLGVGTLGNIEVVGERIEDVSVTDFRHPIRATSTLAGKVPPFIAKVLLGELYIRPRVIRKRCTGCSECEKACPVSAISLTNEKVEINQRLCIACLCCHEVCHFGALILRRPLVGRIMHFFENVRKRVVLASSGSRTLTM